MSDRRCRYCRQLFQPSRFHPHQIVCGSPECQRHHQRDYHRRKIETDPAVSKNSIPLKAKWVSSVLAAARMGPLWQGQMGPGRQTWMAASKGPWWAVDFRVRF